jgi:POT family proton-dependent oligopeptide transporter
MFIGLLIFLSGHRHFSHTRGVDKQRCAVKFVLPTWGWLVVMLCVAPVFFTLLLENNWSGYLLAIVCVFAAQMVARIMVNSRSTSRAVANRTADADRHAVLGSGAAGRSSISLFIDRFVNRRCSPLRCRRRCSSRLTPWR